MMMMTAMPARKPSGPSIPPSGSEEVSCGGFPPSWGAPRTVVLPAQRVPGASVCPPRRVPPVPPLQASCCTPAAGSPTAAASWRSRCPASRLLPGSMALTRRPEATAEGPAFVPAPAGATAGCRMDRTVPLHFGHRDHPQLRAEHCVYTCGCGCTCVGARVGARVGVWHRKPFDSGLLPQGAQASPFHPACRCWGCGYTGEAPGTSRLCLALGDIARTLVTVGRSCCSACNTRTGVCWAEPAARWK